MGFLCIYKLARWVSVPSAHTRGPSQVVECGRHSGGMRGNVEGPPRGSAGLHLPDLLSVFPGNVPCPPQWGHDLPWLCHPALETQGLSLWLGSQRDGSLTRCARDSRRPRFVPLPSPPCPSSGDKPDDLLSPCQCLQLMTPAWWGHHCGLINPGCVATNPSTVGHSGTGTHLPGGVRSPWYLAVGWADSALCWADGWQGSLEEICLTPAFFCKAKSLILASWGKLLPLFLW